MSAALGADQVPAPTLRDLLVRLRTSISASTRCRITRGWVVDRYVAWDLAEAIEEAVGQGAVHTAAERARNSYLRKLNAPTENRH